MKRIISIVCCVIMLMSSAYTVSATEIGDMQNSYTTLSVEFSDNIGQNEDLDIFVKDEHVYANAEQLGERLGYQVEVGKDYAAVYNKQFSNSLPYGLTTFYYDSKKVGHMLFNKMVDYEAPIETIKNDDGAWIPLEFSLLLLNSSDVVLDNQVHIEMPQKNIVDLYMDVLKNNDRYLFDWKNDAGASDGAIFAMGSSAYIVQLFNGVLDTDGASWLQLMNGFCSNTDIYDAKYAQDFAKMFCTYSDEEINQSVSDIKETLKPFNGDNWVIKSIKKIGDLYDDKIGELSKISEDLKTKIDAENKASMIAYNKSYQEFEKLYDRADFFYDATDPFVLASDKVKDATSFLDVYYSISQIVGYASEFNNQDKFAMESLDTLINNSGSQSIMSQNMKNSMKDYKDTLETDVVSYSAYNYLMDNMGDWLTDALDVSSTILDAKSKALLLAWSLSKGTMPFYKNGLSNTDCFLQSMYAGVVQADTMNMYITKRNDVFSDSKNITPEKLYELSKYCYAYLKSCYITRDAAVGSLTEKTKKDNPTYASTQEMVNKEIASCLVKLKNADKNNKYGCYGFLPEDNDKYLEEFDDSLLKQCASIENINVQFDRKIDGNKESATIEAVNENGKFVWKYETQKYDCCMLDRISEVGIRNEKYYLVEDGTIITFDLRNGNVIWKNSDFGGECSSYVFDDNDNLYMCGYDAPDFYAVDKSGNTLTKIDCFSDAFGGAYEINYLGDNVSVKLEIGYDSGEPVIYYVDTNSFEYSLFEDDKIMGRWDNLQATCVAEQYSIQLDGSGNAGVYGAREIYHGEYKLSEENLYEIVLNQEETYDNSQAAWNTININLKASMELSSDGSTCKFRFDNSNYILTKTK